MFRLISSNTQQGLRPVLLLQVRGSLLPINSHSTNPANYKFVSRSNSTISGGLNTTSAAQLTVLKDADRFLKKNQRDILDDQLSEKLLLFQEQLALARQNRGSNKEQADRLIRTVELLIQVFDSAEVRETIQGRDLYLYASILNRSCYVNRLQRLQGSKNRDRDHVHSSNLRHEATIKNGVLRFAELVSQGEFLHLLYGRTLPLLFYLLNLCKLYPELVQLWEFGVGDETLGPAFLDQTVLLVVLPVALREGRFSYEEVMQIVEVNTAGKEIGVDLTASLGRMAVDAGDYAHGLDQLEALYLLHDTSGNAESVLRALGELHLQFIGSCKDINIARNFFDKVVDGGLPYRVFLKVPYVQTLMENCCAQEEPLDTVLYFWSRTLQHYNKVDSRQALNARFAILHNTLFGIFFKMYPALTAALFDELKRVMELISKTACVDEIFLNTLVSNYSWADKAVFAQIAEYYDVHQAKRTPVSYRVLLKKSGVIPDLTSEEIIARWNDCLRAVDKQGLNYIPIADWAALRDATILSPHAATRSELYWKIVHTYRDYFQNEDGVLRFIQLWHKLGNGPNVLRIAERDAKFECDVDVVVLELHSVRPNVDYEKTARRSTL